MDTKNPKENPDFSVLGHLTFCNRKILECVCIYTHTTYTTYKFTNIYTYILHTQNSPHIYIYHIYTTLHIHTCHTHIHKYTYTHKHTSIHIYTHAHTHKAHQAVFRDPLNTTQDYAMKMEK